MTDKEVNKIIAEFMGELMFDKLIQNPEGEAVGIIDRYTKSLDALVPVWKKLNLMKIGYNFGDYLFYTQQDYWGKDVQQYFNFECNIQQSAAHATAKAILELRSNDSEEPT